MKCANCVFFERDEEINGWGNCKRYAPKPDIEPQTVFWPAVKDNDWCGGHKPEIEFVWNIEDKERVE